MLRLLFVCTGNSARSQMAEALVRARSGGAVEVHSAGTQPKPIHPNAVRVMRDIYGVDITHHTPKHVEMFTGERFDRVITLCDVACAAGLPVTGESLHWSIANPATGASDDDTLPLFRQTAADLETRIERLLALLNPLGSPFPTTKEEAMPDPHDMVSVRYMVDDVAKALDFYTGMLGFEVLNAFPPAFADVARGQLRLLLSGPTSSAGRPMPDGERPGPGGWNRIHLIVDDIASEVARLRDAGASFRNDIIKGPGGQQILLQDPCGNIIELFQPAARVA